MGQVLSVAVYMSEKADLAIFDLAFIPATIITHL